MLEMALCWRCPVSPRCTLPSAHQICMLWGCPLCGRTEPCWHAGSGGWLLAWLAARPCPAGCWPAGCGGGGWIPGQLSTWLGGSQSWCCPPPAPPPGTSRWEDKVVFAKHPCACGGTIPPKCLPPVSVCPGGVPVASCLSQGLSGSAGGSDAGSFHVTACARECAVRCHTWPVRAESVAYIPPALLEVSLAVL